ncbi:MAG: MAPEG family protein [Nevskia sp.]|nr:MAPEG family protein [Nevskia sp.]
MIAITSLYAGLLALWFLVLSIRVIQYRGTAKINVGDGGDPTMLRRIRGHANFAEYVPLILLLMALLELGHASVYVLHGLGATLLVGRLLHGISFSFTDYWMPGRFVGVILTFLALLVAGGLCALQGLRALG